MFWPWRKHLIYSSTNLPNLSIVFPSFLQSASDTTQITTSFNCTPPLMLCTHFNDPRGIHVLCCAYGIKYTKTHDAIHNTLLSLHEMLAFTWGENNYMRFLQLCSTLFINKSTLCSPKMKFALKLKLS
jgi:hypothetical protein